MVAEPPLCRHPQLGEPVAVGCEPLGSVAQRLGVRWRNEKATLTVVDNPAGPTGAGGGRTCPAEARAASPSGAAPGRTDTLSPVSVNRGVRRGLAAGVCGLTAYPEPPGGGVTRRIIKRGATGGRYVA